MKESFSLKDIKAGGMVKFYPDYSTTEHEFKFVQDVTENVIVIQGGMRFRKHDGSAIAKGNPAHIER